MAPKEGPCLVDAGFIPTEALCKLLDVFQLRFDSGIVEWRRVVELILLSVETIPGLSCQEESSSVMT